MAVPPYRFDRNSKVGGLLFYIREDTLSKFLKLRSYCNNESICLERVNVTTNEKCMKVFSNLNGLPSLFYFVKKKIDA